MNKSQAIYIFHGTARLAEALSYTRQAIYKWPDILTEKQTKLVLAHAARLNLSLNNYENIE